MRDLDKARAFYETHFGMKLRRDQGQVQLLENGPHRLLLSWSTDAKPAGHAVAGWSVDDVRSTAGRLRKAGVTFETYGFPNQNDVVQLGDDLVVWFKDPDGNVLSLTQFG